ncbi:MAG: hypothetical protein IJI58_05820 [Bacilli bacterium]|nr:hypothetical protein [Bacilli bacterium]
MKKVYIVLTYTGTILSKLVKGYTNDDYAHVSIALDKELKEMYSFGRLNPYIPFIGGFVHESVDRGTFKRFYKTKTKIYSLEVNEEQFIKICNIIKEFNENRHSYKFNVLGLFFAAINLNIKREKCFYCAEFVKYVLDNSSLEVNLPDVVRPNDFNYLKNAKEIYTGILKQYKI